MKCAIYTVLLTLITATGIVRADDGLNAFVASDARTPVYVARDAYRNPEQTLAFFQVQPSDSVVEIWPGGGWYTEILAPWLKPQGTYYAAHFSSAMSAPFFQRARERFEQKIASQPERYSDVELTAFYPPAGDMGAPQESVDKVLTFRNVHNWLKADYAEQAFQAFFAVLKTGGVLGVVEHRAKPGTSLEQMNSSGYVTEAKVKQLAEQAGFEFVASSEINANPKDTTDHPRGVWTLPPSLRLGESNREHYLAIGESDRMTLMFRKPEPKR